MTVDDTAVAAGRDLTARDPTPAPRPPKWLRDIDATLAIRCQFVLYGNIRDYVVVGGTPPACTLVDGLWQTLDRRGFKVLILWDPIHGRSSYPEGREIPLTGLGPIDRTPASLARLLEALAVPQKDQPPVALLIDYASRIELLVRTSDEVFATAEKAAARARKVVRDKGGPACFNPVFWLANRANDLPFWFTTDNQRIGTVSVPLPGADERETWARHCYAYIPDDPDLRDVEAAEFAEVMARLTHGMTLSDVENIARLAAAKGLRASQADDAVERFRVGEVDVDENPWRSTALRSRIAAGGEEIDRFVKGQERAKTQVLDILKRTSIGLTGAQTSSTGSRPRGVLFFAGPTGVGKTELAKTIARIVFGDPNACLRFDMSEFKGEHSGDRLIGAPPGYVGFDQGGELTNAVRENPFRVLLFDEIEKAHPRILDKFLQVLSDGRLTDGRGETVYFSEALIIFTSNVGIVRSVQRADGRLETEQLVTRENQEKDPEAYEQSILKGVKDHFHFELQRPELHNRLGENVVVFNYITRKVGLLILGGMVENIENACLEDTGVRLRLTGDAKRSLERLCTSDDVLNNGGRGIGSMAEAVLVNPLARYLFDKHIQDGTVTIRGFEFDERSSAYQIDARDAPAD